MPQMWKEGKVKNWTSSSVLCRRMAAREYCQITAPPDAILPFFSLSLSLVLLCFSVPGNALVCVVVWKDPRKDLRSPFTYLLVNLAVADLITGGVTDFSAALFAIAEIQSAVPTPGLVYVTHLSLFISCTASVLTLSALALDRYGAISRPLRYRASRTTRKAKRASLIIWLCSLSLPWVYLQVGYAPHLFVFANTAVLAAVCIFALAYVKIFRTLRARTEQINAMQASESGEKINHHSALLFEKKLTKTYLVMVAAFLVCYAPSCALIYTLYFCSACSCSVVHWIRDLVFFLIVTNSSINPFLYAWRLRAFRRGLCSVVFCKVPRIAFKPRSPLTSGRKAPTTN